jgi:hypothetical protein
VKTFDTQHRVYEEVTVASCVLLDEERAAGEIARRRGCSTFGQFAGKRSKR